VKINSLDELTTGDPTTHRKGFVDPEGRAADGIVKLNTSFGQDVEAYKTARENVKNKKAYNACTNNCSTFAQKVINSAIDPKVDASQRVTPEDWARVIYRPATVVAPNNLYNAALLVKGSTRIKGPASVEAKPYLDYFKKE